MQYLTIKEARQLIIDNINADIPTFADGGIGIGKTQIVYQIKDEVNYDLVVYIPLSTCNPVDVGGSPFVANRDSDDPTTRWATAEFWKICEGKKVLVFMDEITTAAQAVQVTALKIVNEKRVGNYMLPPETRFICAGNRLSDNTLTNSMPRALQLRHSRFTLITSVADWRVWAIDNNIDSRLLAFILFTDKPNEEGEDQERAGMLYWYDRKIHSKEEQNPNPRGWEFANRYLLAGLEGRRLQNAIHSVVGKTAAEQFVAFLSVAEQIPNVTEILEKGKLDIMPPNETDHVDQLYAFTTALAAYVVKATGRNQIKYACNLMAYSTKQLSAEFGVKTLKDCLRAKSLRAQAAKILASKEWKQVEKIWGQYLAD